MGLLLEVLLSYEVSISRRNNRQYGAREGEEGKETHRSNIHPTAVRNP